MNNNNIIKFIVVTLCTISLRIVVGVANLKYFETFSYIGVTSRLKRWKESQELIKEVNFKAFNRNFHLTLKAGTQVLAKKFTAHLVEEDDRLTQFSIDQNIFFSGHLTDNPNVTVNAHMEDTLWSILIYDVNNTFAIEPALNLLKSSENPQNDTMIAYRSSDLAHDEGMCGARYIKRNDQEERSAPYSQYNTSDNNHESREKREGKDNTCVIYLVGDFDLFSKRCKKNHLVCSALLISLVQNADTTFRNSRFQDSHFHIHTDIGIQIAKLVLYTTPTYTSDTRFRHFNAKDVNWNAFSKLDSFEYFMSFRNKKYCLSHLVTTYPMPYRILGLAEKEGLCTKVQQGTKISSAGLTSCEDSKTGPITTYQINLVFTHGHNFGSEHDPATKECSQPDNQGGNFIMWERATVGTLHNNRRFSPCSLRSIGRALMRAKCLYPRSKYSVFCGNGIVDHGEECDAGAIGIVNADVCCTKTCRLVKGATCSDMNHECCSNCELAKRGTVCYDSGVVDCKTKSYCTGGGLFCPRPAALPDWTMCHDGSQCHDGVCKGYCEIKSIKMGLSLKPCLCQSSDNSACRWCCFDNKNPFSPGACVPHSNELLQDGRPCYKGFCEAGLCKSNITTTIRRIRNILTVKKRDALGKFLRANIVFIVIIISLILCVPCRILLSYYDDYIEAATQVQLEALLTRGFVDKRRREARRREGITSWEGSIKESKTTGDKSMTTPSDSKCCSSEADVDDVLSFLRSQASMHSQIHLIQTASQSTNVDFRERESAGPFSTVQRFDDTHTWTMNSEVSYPIKPKPRSTSY